MMRVLLSMPQKQTQDFFSSSNCKLFVLVERTIYQPWVNPIKTARFANFNYSLRKKENPKNADILYCKYEPRNQDRPLTVM